MKIESEIALEKWMEEITSLLCYYSDFSAKHKRDLEKAFELFLRSKAENVSSPSPD